MASILSIGTATPKCKISQDLIAEQMIDVLGFKGEKARWLREIYNNSAIKERGTIVSDEYAHINLPFFYEIFSEKPPGMTRRNQIYRKEAPKLAFEAVKDALEKWDDDVQKITHVVSVSCTGVITPGIELALVNLMGLKQDTYRLGINFMGCFGALKGLSVAQALAKENQEHYVLLVCTELCSLHMQPEKNPDVLISNAIFSDGAAAVIIGNSIQHGLYQMIDHHSLFLEKTEELMQWNGSDQGLEIVLSKEIPEKINHHIELFVDNILKRNGVEKRQCDWAIHPGGKAIIEAIEKKIGLEKSQTEASWNVLEKYGNMSSPTVLFVLKELLKKPSHKEFCPMIGFGPGLSMEGVLLWRDPKKKN